MDDEIARAARAKKGSPFLSTEQAAFYLGLSARKMQAMRRAGSGPVFRRHSRYVRYLDVQPTITVRPGWPVLAIVNKDLVLQPWRG